MLDQRWGSGSPMSLLQSLTDQARRGYLDAQRFQVVWSAYTQALHRGGEHLVDAASIWQSVLDRVLNGEISFPRAMELWESFLATGRARQAASLIVHPDAGTSIKDVGGYVFPFRRPSDKPGELNDEPYEFSEGTFLLQDDEERRDERRTYAPRPDPQDKVNGDGDDDDNGDECLDKKCELAIYTDDAQLTTPALKELKDKAFKKRTEESNAFKKQMMDQLKATVAGAPAEDAPKVTARNTGNHAKITTLGHSPKVKGEFPGLMRGEATTLPVSENMTAFMAVFKYDCECPESVLLRWYKLNMATKKFEPDPAQDKDGKWFSEKLVVKDEQKKGEKGGECTLTAIDTPGNMRFFGEPESVNGVWRVLGKVKWENGNECEVTKQLTIKNGKPQPVETVPAK